ncbi:MAG TPA: Tol-Pal system protein TolB, partial [Erythrobacter sp.]|nr:Tol-Pal system protein TolB [Erythrobacter sp.]
MKYLLFAIAFAAAPIAAQNQDLGRPVAEGGQVETTGTDASGEAADGGLTFTVTDESDWADLGVAIPGFAADRDVPTPANADGTAALGREIARVITANLQNNGLFKPVGPNSLPQPTFAEITSPSWGTWRGRGA